MRHSYLKLPVDADAGFPQAVRIVLGTTTYLTEYTVSVTDDALLAVREPLELPRPGAYLVLHVAREDADGPRTLFRRKVVPDLEYEADEVALVFTGITVHPLNLNAAGAHGSAVRGGVALLWGS